MTTNDLVAQTEILVDVAVLGEQMQQFILSDVGQYLIKKIDNEVDEAYNAFRAVRVSDTVAVYEIQNRLLRAESIKEWLTQAVENGLRALSVLESRQDE